MFASVSFIVMTAYNVLREEKKVEVRKHKCLSFHFVLCKVFNVPFSPSFSFLCVIDSFSLPIFSFLSFFLYVLCDVCTTSGFDIASFSATLLHSRKHIHSIDESVHPTRYTVQNKGTHFPFYP